MLEWYNQDPGLGHEVKPLAAETTMQAQMFFADHLPEGVPPAYWLRVRTTYTAPKTCTLRLGYCVAGKGKLYVDGKEVIDLVTSQPPKTVQTPMFNEGTMEVIHEMAVEEGKKYELTGFIINDKVSASGAVLVAGGVRFGCCEKIDPEVAIAEAVKLASQVDIPILIAGLNSDYETEAADRSDLSFPPYVDELIENVVKANPNTVSLHQIPTRRTTRLTRSKGCGDPSRSSYRNALDRTLQHPLACLVRRSRDWQCDCGCALWKGQPKWAALHDIPKASGRYTHVSHLWES